MEELQCIFTSPGLRICYDAENQWLYNQWIGEHSPASLLQHRANIHACLRAFPCTKILSDHTMLVRDWSSAAPTGPQMFEPLAALGIRYFAWVYSPHCSDQVAMMQAKEQVSYPMIGVFSDLYAAYTWLQQRPLYCQPRTEYVFPT